MIEKLLVSEVRVKLLKELLFKQEESFHVRELTRRVGTEINAVRRELQNLEDMGLVKKRGEGNKVYYDLIKDHCYYSELMGLLGKEFGLGSLVLKNIKKLGDIRLASLRRAFLEGKKAEGTQVDLLLVGEVNLKSAEEIMAKYKEKTGVDVNYTVMDPEEFSFRKNRKDPFVMGIVLTPKIMLAGDEENLVN